MNRRNFIVKAIAGAVAAAVVPFKRMASGGTVKNEKPALVGEHVAMPLEIPQTHYSEGGIAYAWYGSDTKLIGITSNDRPLQSAVYMATIIHDTQGLPRYFDWRGEVHPSTEMWYDGPGYRI